MTTIAELAVGVWILTESSVYDSIGLPKQVTKLSGSRVYWNRPKRRKDGTPDGCEEGYSRVTSVRFVVPTEAVGIAAFNEQSRLRAIMYQENAESLKKYRQSFKAYVQEQKGASYAN